MKNEGRSIKFQLMFSPSELAAVDEYRWRNRVRSRAEAIRHLVAVGVIENEKGPAEAATSPSYDQNHNPAKNGGIDA